MGVSLLLSGLFYKGFIIPQIGHYVPSETVLDDGEVGDGRVDLLWGGLFCHYPEQVLLVVGFLAEFL